MNILFCVGGCYKMLDKLFNKKEDDERNPVVQKYFGKGKDYIEKQEFQPAIESFKRCIQEDPEDSIPYIGLCIAYSGLMDLKTAREYYEKLKKADPYLAAQFENTPEGSILKSDDDSPDGI